MNRGVKTYRNEDVQRIIAFIPPGHQHIRLAIEFKDQIVILHEATVAAIVRAYIDIVSHPTRKAVELIQSFISERKPGYAKNQLIETGKSESEIIEYITKLIENSGNINDTTR